MYILIKVIAKRIIISNFNLSFIVKVIQIYLKIQEFRKITEIKNY